MIAILHAAFLSLAPFVVVISLIVTVHELGHFLTAKAFGVAIERFSIGFGSALAKWRDRSGVEWRIAWIPLGGYVKFAGDENVASAPDARGLEALRTEIEAREGPGAASRYLAFKPLWQRTLIVIAGPVANFLLAIAIFAAFFAAFGESATPPVVRAVIPGEAGARAGILAGDRITALDGHRVSSFEDVQFYIEYRVGTPVDVSLDRKGLPLTVRVTPDAAQEKSLFGGAQAVGRLGLVASAAPLRHVGPVRAVELGVSHTYGVAATTLYYLGRIVSGQVNADQLHSVVGMVHASGALTHQAETAAHDSGVSWATAEIFLLSQLAAVISVSIGLMNLLPIPTLDGGHLVFYAYEALARRPAAAALQAAGYRAGLALLVGLMLFATWNDLARLRLFQIFGSLFS
ncbi:MAG: RIP metalloprotease [Alphaproteobacteria bacterium]|nr:RIP metalloprotease [Alphaproteobacteria bacterium]